MTATIKNIRGRDLTPDLLHQVDISLDQFITITIQAENNVKEKTRSNPKRRLDFLHTSRVANKVDKTTNSKKRKLDFLYNGIWEGDVDATDVAENHDKYLYDVNPHNEVQ